MPKQRWKSFTGGGHGGKTTNQGEHGAEGRVPDTKLGERVSWAASCAGSSKKGQAITIHRLLHHVSVTLLANSFYALTGEVIVVRYADDSVLGFQYGADAERFLREWRERLLGFGLELHPGKTRLIEFGRFAARNRKRLGAGKPETFNFLGFTHICGQGWENGKFFVLRKTVRERLLAKLKQVKAALRVRMHQPVAEVGKWLRSVVQGYFNYHAVPGNFASLWRFRIEVRKRWLHVIRRRSQRSRMTWELLERLAVQWLPIPKILHPYPMVRFAAKYPR